MLFGIVAKNSILLIDFAIEEMARGADKFHAIVEAGHKRAQPIVMTTVAMVAVFGGLVGQVTELARQMAQQRLVHGLFPKLEQACRDLRNERDQLAGLAAQAEALTAARAMQAQTSPLVQVLGHVLASRALQATGQIAQDPSTSVDDAIKILKDTMVNQVGEDQVETLK